jgi:hypothetical protein
MDYFKLKTQNWALVIKFMMSFLIYDSQPKNEFLFSGSEFAKSLWND